jgi:ADP-ribose pyrophosphatase
MTAIDISPAPQAECMDSGEPPTGGSDFEIQRMVGANFLHPLITEEVQVICDAADLRVEHNRVRNVATDEVGLALRVVPADGSRYGSVVVPVLFDGRFVLVGRYRYPLGRWSIEFPRAAIQTRDSGWKHSSRKHLLKHAGLKATRMTLLGAIEPEPALIALPTIVVLAEGCVERHASRANPRQLIAGTIAVSSDELDHLVRRGEIACGVTLAALSLYHARGQR